MFNWQGRTDSEDGEKGLRWHQRVKHDIDPQDFASDAVTTDVALVGFASDLGVEHNKGRLGAAAGPNAIRGALANLPWHWPYAQLTDFGDVGVSPIQTTNGTADETANSQHSSHGISDIDSTSRTAQEAIPQCALSQAQNQYANAISYALTADLHTKANGTTNKEPTDNQRLVIGLGGGHEIAWGSYLGLFNAHTNNTEQATVAGKRSGKRIGIINFDAHFDLRKPAPNTSSGTPFRQVYEHCQLHNVPFHYACIGVSKAANTSALFEFADSSNTRYVLDTQCNFSTICDTLAPMLQDIDLLYVTVCLDAFPAAAAPGVSAPSALGADPLLVIRVLRYLAEQQQAMQYQWQLCDIAEMNPQFDIDSRTAKLAARLIFEVTDALV